MKAFGFDESDFVPCEVCNGKAVDIHHIESRGMGGSKKKDNPDNLMALCRTCHDKFGDKQSWIFWLKNVHSEKSILNKQK